MSTDSIALITQSCEFREHTFFRWLNRLDQIARYGPWPGDSQDRGGHVAFGRQVERLAAELLRDRGYLVRTTTHKAHHDLWAGGAKIEVKGARWDGRRWQWNMRNSQADVYLLACCDDTQAIAWFVIPGADVGDRRGAAIWTEDPAAYSGQWAPYLGAWELADIAIEGTAAPWQLGLWD